MDLLLLAQEAAQAAQASGGELHPWAKYILGPLGALILLGIYAWHTERTRMPKLASLLLTEQKKSDTLRDECDAAKKELRTKHSEELALMNEKLNKEVRARIYWQTHAEALGAEYDSIPKDIGRTAFGGE